VASHVLPDPLLPTIAIRSTDGMIATHRANAGLSISVQGARAITEEGLGARIPLYFFLR
jgi:hypothetical protein